MTELPFLLRLLTDRSPRVREKVEFRLRELGPSLWDEITSQNLNLSLETERQLRAIWPRPTSIVRDNGLILPDDWLTWLELPTFEAQLEAAWELISRWQYASRDEIAPDLGDLLDRAAHAFLDATDEDGRTPIVLARFLADELNFRGASSDDYYNPLNSNLIWAVKERCGLPITLAGAWILVADRAGVQMWGVNFPGHFLVGARNGKETVFFDPFNGGYEFSPGEADALRRASSETVREAATAPDIIARVLRNLALAYQHEGELEHARFVYDLLSRLENAVRA